MTTIKTSLAQIVAERSARQATAAPSPPTARARAAKIDFSDQEEITAAKLADGTYRVVQRGGARPGAGRPALGKRQKTVKLSPAAIRKIEAHRRQHGLPHFSAAIEHLAGL